MVIRRVNGDCTLQTHESRFALNHQTFEIPVAVLAVEPAACQDDVRPSITAKQRITMRQLGVVAGRAACCFDKRQLAPVRPNHQTIITRHQTRTGSTDFVAFPDRPAGFPIDTVNATPGPVDTTIVNQGAAYT